MKTMVGKDAVKIWIVKYTEDRDDTQILTYQRSLRKPKYKHGKKRNLQEREIPDPEFWGLPGGARDSGENLLEAMLRELEEEWISKKPLFNFDFVGRILPKTNEKFDAHYFFRAEFRGELYLPPQINEGKGTVYHRPQQILESSFKIPEYFKIFLRKNVEGIIEYNKQPNLIIFSSEKAKIYPGSYELQIEFG